MGKVLYPTQFHSRPSSRALVPARHILPYKSIEYWIQYVEHTTNGRGAIREICDIIENHLPSEVRSIGVASNTQKWVLETHSLDALYDHLAAATTLSVNTSPKLYWEYIQTIRAALDIKLVEGS